MAYRASKAAMNMVAACYAKEQARFGVKVLAVHPGTIKRVLQFVSNHVWAVVYVDAYQTRL